jgi:hypothetical protein
MTFVYFLWIGSGAETGAEAPRFSCAFAARLKSCPSKPITFPQGLESCPDTKARVLPVRILCPNVVEPQVLRLRMALVRQPAIRVTVGYFLSVTADG